MVAGRAPPKLNGSDKQTNKQTDRYGRLEEIHAHDNNMIAFRYVSKKGMLKNQRSGPGSVLHLHPVMTKEAFTKEGEKR